MKQQQKNKNNKKQRASGDLFSLSTQRKKKIDWIELSNRIFIPTQYCLN